MPMPAFTDGSSAASRPKKISGGMQLLLGCGIVVFLVAALAGGAAVWGFKKLEHANRTLQQAHEDYLLNERTYVFVHPAEGAKIPAERWERMLKVRSATLGALDPRATRVLSSLLEDPQQGPKALDLIALPQIAERVIDANLAALRKNQMALEEYLFLTGVLVANTLKQTENPATASYREAMNGLVQTLHQQSDARTSDSMPFDPQHFQSQIDHDYGAWSVDQPEIYAQLAAQDRSEALGDVMLALFAPMIKKGMEQPPATEPAAAGKLNTAESAESSATP